MVEILICKGADINAKNIYKLNMFKLFLIKINLKRERKLKEENMTPIHYAARFNYKEIGEILISKGVDINVKEIIYLN